MSSTLIAHCGTRKIGRDEWSDVNVVKLDREESGIAKLWARQKIEALLDSEGALAENSDFALGRAHLPDQHFHERRFTGAVWAE